MFWSSRVGALPRRLLIVAAVALIPAVAGCEAGDNAPTQQWHYPTVGAGTQVGGISIRNVFVLGAPGGQALAAGTSAGLFLALANTGNPDRLISVQAPRTATAVTLQGGSLQLGTSQAILLTGPRPRAVLTGLTRPLAGGAAVTLILTFQNAGNVTLRVPVIPSDEGYATFSPAPTPSPTRSPRKRYPSSASPSASPSPTPSTSSTP